MYARQTLDRFPEDCYFQRGTPAVILGLACCSKGDMEAAHRSLTEATSKIRMGDIDFAINGASILAELRMAQGRLHEAAHA